MTMMMMMMMMNPLKFEFRDVVDVHVVCAGPGTTKFASFDDRHWHNECFVCSKCHVSLIGQGFLLNGPDVICTHCVPN